jgi:ABC-type lipoprotein release transport system permease subunit
MRKKSANMAPERNFVTARLITNLTLVTLWFLTVTGVVEQIFTPTAHPPKLQVRIKQSITVAISIIFILFLHPHPLFFHLLSTALPTLRLSKTTPLEVSREFQRYWWCAVGPAAVGLSGLCPV